MEYESGNISSSEESLIYSQETFHLLFDGLKGTGLDDLDCSILAEVNVAATEEIVEQKPLLYDSSFVVKEEFIEVPEADSILEVANVSSTQSNASHFQEQQNKPSSLPAIQNWSGAYGFNISFKHQENVSKKVAWVYSPEKSKLYVKKDAPCPINFSTTSRMPEGTFIRAMPLFCTPEHAAQLVHRCHDHSFEDESRGVVEAKHLIRCECDSVSYEVDLHSHRQSVVVPFDNPAVGQLYSTYLYKFVCFGSCSGGPNRRPLMVVFTLERGNQVLGRQRFDLKICACPARDRKNEERQSSRELESVNLPLKRKESNKKIRKFQDDSNLLKSEYPATKKTKTASNKDGHYVIAVEDRKMYEFLKHMKHFYKMCEMMKSAPPAITNQLYQLYIKTKGKKDEFD